MLVLAFFAVSVALSRTSSLPSLELIETVPLAVRNVTKSPLRSIADAWLDLIEGAAKSIRLASLYVQLSDGGQLPGAQYGRAVFDALMAAVKRGVLVQIVVPWPSMASDPWVDITPLMQAGAQVGRLEWNYTTGVKGMLHGKFMAVDSLHAYVGSADFSWSALATVEQTGIVAWNNPVLASDVDRVFAQFFDYVGKKQPAVWPSQYDALTNAEMPADRCYISIDPEMFASASRAKDVQTILNVVESVPSGGWIKLSVMDYYVLTLYQTNPVYWPILDNAIRNAAARGVEVKCLFGIWEMTDSRQYPIWLSLNNVENISVRVHIMPDGGMCHSKFIATSNDWLIETQNFVPDYFLHDWTGGMSLRRNVTGETFDFGLEQLFDRDWASPFAHDIDRYFNVSGF